MDCCERVMSAGVGNGEVANLNEKKGTCGICFKGSSAKALAFFN